MSSLTSSPLFETTIGLVLLWFLLATLASGIVELVASIFGFRAKHLWSILVAQLSPTPSGRARAVTEATTMGTAPELADGTVANQFLDHVPGANDEVVKRVRELPRTSFAEIIAAIRSGAGFNATQLGQLIQSLPVEVRDNADTLREWNERWFDGLVQTMQSSYKRNIRWWAALAGLIVVVVTGADALGAATQLYQEPTQRALALEVASDAIATRTTPTTTPSEPGGGDSADTPVAADDAADDCATDTKTETSEAADAADDADAGSDAPPTTIDPSSQVNDQLDCARRVAADISGLQLSAWQDLPDDGWGWVALVVGLLLSWAAVMAGAPFWFSVLKRLMTPVTSRSSAS